MVCNYATTNVLYRTIYNSGEPGTECTSGLSDNYVGMCSAKEKYPTDSQQMTAELQNATAHADAEATATANGNSSSAVAIAIAGASANASAIAISNAN